MSNFPRALLLALATLLAAGLTGCGWHLRGDLNLSEEARRIHLTDSRVNVELRRELERLFTQSGVELSADKSTSYTLHLTSANEDRRVSSLGSDAVADSVSLTLSLSYSIIAPAGQVVVEPVAISVTRSYNYDRDNVAAKAEEEQLLKSEIRREVVQQILRGYRYAVENAQTAAPASDSSAPDSPTPVAHESLDE
ncbi:LPS assembly lipoprotein LptE [Halioxenophilus sp. WMMB6]|uniref:LPS-assembly lipoprotein LptE n=1 Tax=Halioxenophilus sp. WMMB6 TaxID=3073815 RepID=UPI00295EA3EF|nr:LPS assembly lipoprotein LptE [Halioxenophilus sp. WMMB6]